LSPADYQVLYVAVALFLLASSGSIVALYLHERREFRKADQHETRAEAREERAKQRHDAQMKALADNRALTLAAIDQRSRLEFRTDWLETAILDHGLHLEALGRTGVAKVPPPRR
jgi:lysylphosphatidylglycerol synthetase-like protein (DUF2156 family)